MKIGYGVLSLVLVAALVSGCGKKEESGSTGDTSGSAGTAASATATPTPTPIPTPVVPPKPVNNDADAAAVRGCCAALHKAANDEKDSSTKSKYTNAASACDAMAEKVKTGAVPRSGAIGSIRASAGGKALPAGCN